MPFDAEGRPPSPPSQRQPAHDIFQQTGLRHERAQLGIVTEAWSPLASGQVLDDPVITQIADAHGRTPRTVVIRWHLQLGNVVIPKSVTPERIIENFNVFDFTIIDDEMAAIEALDAGTASDPTHTRSHGPEHPASRRPVKRRAGCWRLVSPSIG
jgi:2,5-diketo-D-gluconate reductase A